MIAPRNRMRRAQDFQAASRGRRFTVAPVVLCLGSRNAVSPSPSRGAQVLGRDTLVGFAVGRAVGNAVTRHRVTRRLRAIVGALVTDMPPGSLVVVRALPGAGESTFAQLESSVRSCIDRAQASS